MEWTFVITITIDYEYMLMILKYSNHYDSSGKMSTLWTYDFINLMDGLNCVHCSNTMVRCGGDIFGV